MKHEHQEWKFGDILKRNGSSDWVVMFIGKTGTGNGITLVTISKDSTGLTTSSSSAFYADVFLWLVGSDSWTLITP